MENRWSKMGRHLDAIEKAVKFFPDECSAKWYKTENNKWKLIYEERFNYLPDEVARIICALTVKFLQDICRESGLDKLADVNYSLIKKGIRLEAEGDIRDVGGFLVMEIMGQSVADWEDAFKKLTALMVTVVAVLSGEKVREYNEIVKKFEQIIRETLEEEERHVGNNKRST